MQIKRTHLTRQHFQSLSFFSDNAILDSFLRGALMKLSYLKQSYLRNYNPLAKIHVTQLFSTKICKRKTVKKELRFA